MSLYGVDYSEEPPLDPYDAEVEAQLAFNRDVADAAHRLRVQSAARVLIEAERQGEAPPFDIGTLRDVLELPPEPPFRAEGLVPSDAGVLLVAQRKTGKTTLTLNYARALLEGGDFLGRFPTRPITGTVCLLNYEVSGRQLARWADEHHLDPDRFVLVNLRGRRNPLGHADDRARLAAALRARNVEALVVDPFGRAYTGVNQNDPGEVGAFLVGLDEFTRAGVGATDLVLTAHAGWNGERTRGSSALEDWADVVVTMTRKNDDEDDPRRYLRAVGRDVDLDEDALEFHEPTRTLTLTGAGSRKKARANQKLAELAVLVVRAARTQPGASGAEVERLIRGMDDAPGFQRGDIGKAAAYAEQQGQLVIERGGPGCPSRHYLPEAIRGGSSPTTPGEVTDP